MLTPFPAAGLLEPAPLLDAAGIAALIPHQGRMCLLDGLEAWGPGFITCTASGQADPDHPLRSPQGLDAVCAIEYAAQAMALHGALSASPGSAPKGGFLAAARQVKLHVPRLDAVPGRLTVQADRRAGDSHQALYQFSLLDETGALLVDGRATVVLDTPLSTPASAAAPIDGLPPLPLPTPDTTA
jgi:predicted hotdog family 3-hydroxylacyl-ACP dehydratase